MPKAPVDEPLAVAAAAAAVVLVALDVVADLYVQFFRGIWRILLTRVQDGGKDDAEGTEEAAAPTAANDEVLPLTDITNKNTTDNSKSKDKSRPAREKKERGPPADGIPSKTKVMVANLPYDLTEEKVRDSDRVDVAHR